MLRLSTLLSMTLSRTTQRSAIVFFHIRAHPALCASLVLIAGAPLTALANPASDEAAGQAIVGRFLDASQTQQQTLRGGQMEVKIAAKVPKLAKQGELQALRSISKFGKITYRALGFSGDSFVKNEVISRYLTAEGEPRNVAITPENYKFKYKGPAEFDGRRVEVFQLTPLRKAEGLFRGELWLDGATGMPVRESGRLVKAGSIFLKKVEFVSSFDIKDGVAIPRHFESTVDTRVVGRAELSIDFSNFSRPEAVSDDLANAIR